MISPADRDQVLAFRLDGHNLARQLPPGSLIEAAAACGIQNTPPGSAALALHARVSDLTPADLDRALVIAKTLLQVWSLRSSPLFFPTSHAAVFTIGLMPGDEESLRFYLQGFAPILDQIGMTATEAVELTAAALYDALDGRVLTKHQMGAELAKRLPPKLRPWCEPNTFTSFGAMLVRPIALRGTFCFAPREGSEASFIRTDQWLGAPLPDVDPSEPRGELVRRYLHCYGPSTASHFAEWAGIAPAQAHHAWQLVEAEIVEVALDGNKTWLHKRDVSRFTSPPTPAGVRILPPYDPYLLQRDRETLLPDKALHPHIWRSTGNPGVVLLDGRIVATWRPQKKGKRLLVTCTLFTPVARKVRSAIVAEAILLAPYRGCTSVEVKFAESESKS